jgi:hypothetical protein
MTGACPAGRVSNIPARPPAAFRPGRQLTGGDQGFSNARCHRPRQSRDPRWPPAGAKYRADQEGQPDLARRQGIRDEWRAGTGDAGHHVAEDPKYLIGIALSAILRSVPAILARVAAATALPPGWPGPPVRFVIRPGSLTAPASMRSAYRWKGDMPFRAFDNK